jgi:hypothetical protein
MSAEHIRIMCPSLTCRKILAVPTTSRGKNVRCKSCGATIRVPDNRPKPSSAAPGQTPPAGGSPPGQTKAA